MLHTPPSVHPCYDQERFLLEDYHLEHFLPLRSIPYTIHLTNVLMLYGIFLQVNQDKTFENSMVKHQIYTIMTVVNHQWILATNESKTFAQLQKECLKIVYQPLFQILFTIAFTLRNSEKFQSISLLDYIFGLLDNNPFLSQLHDSFLIFTCSQTKVQSTINLTAQRPYAPILCNTLLLVKATFQVIIYSD